EITGPCDRKMMVNALNSGAKVFMADFEDATSPTFANLIEGQANLKDRWAGTIDFTDPATGKTYALKRDPAVLIVRPRGWHLPAAFEMDEILYELRDHIVGLNCGRWDHIFSFIKRLGKNPAFLTPNRAEMTMGKAFLNAYSLQLIKTCHRRGAFAMGGMAAQIPIKNDPSANEAAFAKVRADKEREASDGHDGTWVAHPDLVPVARDVFDRLMPGSNQLDRLRDDVSANRDMLLDLH